MYDIRTQIKACKNCQRNNKKILKYGHLPAKEAETIPWDILLVDLIGPYKISREGREKYLILKSLTMIDP